MLQEADIGIGISGVEGMQVFFERIAQRLYSASILNSIWKFISFCDFVFSAVHFDKYLFPNCRQLCQVTLQLLSSDIWSGCFLCMDIGVTEGSQQW